MRAHGTFWVENWTQRMSANSELFICRLLVSESKWIMNILLHQERKEATIILTVHMHLIWLSVVRIDYYMVHICFNLLRLTTKLAMCKRWLHSPKSRFRRACTGLIVLHVLCVVCRCLCDGYFLCVHTHLYLARYGPSDRAIQWTWIVILSK